MERVKEEGRRRSVEGVWVLFGRLVARLFILPSFDIIDACEMVYREFTAAEIAAAVLESSDEDNRWYETYVYHVMCNFL